MSINEANDDDDSGGSSSRRKLMHGSIMDDEDLEASISSSVAATATVHSPAARNDYNDDNESANLLISRNDVNNDDDDNPDFRRKSSTTDANNKKLPRPTNFGNPRNDRYIHNPYSSTSASHQTAGTVNHTAAGQNRFAASTNQQYQHQQTFSAIGTEEQCLLSTQERNFMNRYVYGSDQDKSVPWRGICLAWTLLSFGITFFCIGVLLLAGIVSFQSLDGLTPYGLLIFGLICIIPGAYHIGNAICVTCGQRGYSWEDIPNFD